LKVPLNPFFTESAVKGKYIVESISVDFGVQGPMLPENATVFITSGPDGATLKKKGKGFMLLEGEAYLLRAGKRDSEH